MLENKNATEDSPKKIKKHVVIAQKLLKKLENVWERNANFAMVIAIMKL
jgi:inosine/xanthosine triphosphate pyrophosphatase family protein